MTDKLKEEKLLGKLDQWIGRARRDEAPDNIIWHIDDDSAYQDIVALIQKFSEECVKSYKTGYKAGIVNENSRMRKKPKVTDEWYEERVKEFLKKTYGKPIYPISVRDLTDFIRKLIKEIQGR